MASARSLVGTWIAAVMAWGLIAPPAIALDLPVPVDKAAHFGLGYVLTDQMLRAGLSREEAVAATLAVGWLKEVTDRRPDPADMVANVAGALAAAYLRLEVRF